MSTLTLPTDLLIDGAFVPGEGDAEKVLNPATGALLLALPEASVEQVNKAVSAAHRAFDEIAAFALSLGGTITGEHGVGLLKRDLLETELDSVAAELQRGIKELLDPHYLLNPGKVLTARS